MNIKKALIIPDCHVPFHDVRAYALMLKVAKEIDPDEIIVGGDFGDFYSINSHGGNKPDAENLLKKELRAVRDKLRELEKLFPKAKKVYIQGNHEYRFERYIAERAPELFDLISVPEILDLKEWEFVPYTPNQLYQVMGSKLYARHEPYSGGIHAAYGTVSKGLASFVYFHTHRSDSAHIVSANQKDFRAYCPGWLGDKNSFAFNYVKNHHQWTLGFGVVYGLPKGNFFYRQIDISSSKCLFNGKLYEQNH